MKEEEIFNLKLISIKDRRNKLNVSHFIKDSIPDRFSLFLDYLPAVFKANDLREFVSNLKNARDQRKPIIWMVGDAVIKCGLSPLLSKLAEEGYITWLAGQGAVAIHDFEIAMFGETSEFVEETIRDGKFGMTKETMEFFNEALKRGYKEKKGMGEVVPEVLLEKSPPYSDKSLMCLLNERKIPMSFHVAVGTDIIHMFPFLEGDEVGFTTLKDFKRFISYLSKLEGGGVVINVASAVLMPEVFLKSLSVVRNLGYRVYNFFACNIDQIQHYRPLQNVVERPTKDGGKGVSFTLHIEIFLPLLGAILLNY
ncbi:MAG: hypothetical protein ABDH37_02415 [Candidatus Hydrothermales bacterium]